jgi:hypothetical protein
MVLLFGSFAFGFGNLENAFHILQGFQSCELEVVDEDAWFEWAEGFGQFFQFGPLVR